jgi:excisionase family DNA binding protein
MNTQQKRNISTKEAAARLGVCAATIYRWIRDQQIQAFKMSKAKSGAGYRIPEEQIAKIEAGEPLPEPRKRAA